MGRKQLLYHATTPDCAKKILQEGLKRQNKPWVYLSEDPKSWWQPGLALLQVRITGLKGDMRTFLPELDEILYEGDINPERNGDEFDADWVSEQYNNACISIERIRDAAKLDRGLEDA